MVIKDEIDVKTIRAVLQYFYTSFLPKLSMAPALKFLKAAHTYNLSAMAKKVEDHIGTIVTANDVGCDGVWSQVPVAAANGQLQGRNEGSRPFTGRVSWL